MERRQQESYTCDDSDRAWVGTFSTPELQKAIEKGYKISKINEVYHWRETARYDSDAQTGGHIASYINLFLKIKQEASGRPTWVQTRANLLENTFILLEDNSKYEQ